MEDFYEKYAKPIKDISISETKSKLEDWQNYTKEEIELLIFIITSLDNDNRNCLSQSSKMALISTLDKLKTNSIVVLNKISDLLCKIDTEEFNEITNKIYLKFEQIRNDYNKQLQFNYNTLLEKEIFSELRNEYYSTQKWLRDKKKAQTDRNLFNHTNTPHQQHQSSRQRISKASTQLNIPTLNMTKVKESVSRNKVPQEDNTYNGSSNNNNHHHHSVFTQIFLDKSKHNTNNHNHNREQNNNNAKWLANQSSDSERNEPQPKQRPLSQRNKLPPRHSSQESLLNYTDTTYLNKIPPCSDQFSQIIQIKTEIMLIQEEIKKLKGKTALKQPIKRKPDEDFASQVTQQNTEIWNEMSIMRKEMNELFNTVKTLNEKITDVLEDNKSLQQENNQMKDQIYQLKQDKNNKMYHANHTNINNGNSRNSNSTSYLFKPQAKTNLSANTKQSNHGNKPFMKGQRLNYQYDSSSYNSVSDIDNYNKITTSKDE